MSGKLPAIPLKAGNPCFENRCSACCHDTEMLLTEADVGRLSRLRPGVGFWFQADDGFLQLANDRSASPAAGARSPDAHPCVFLGRDGRCTVWEDRPEGCRLYPAVWDGTMSVTTLDAEHCPHTGGFRLAGATADAVRRLVGVLERERDARLGRPNGPFSRPQS